MFKDKTRTSQKTNLTKDTSETSDTLIKQVNYLQKVLGNKEVEELMNQGIISQITSLNLEENLEQGIIRSKKKKEEYEEEQIKKDREALLDEIQQILIKKKDKADELVDSSRGMPVYVNVTTHLVYAEIPGKKPSLFYHYTDLVDVDLSYQNINHKAQGRKIKRGMKISYIFSLKYEPEEEEKEVIGSAGEEELEETAEKEKAPRKSKLSPKGKTERTKRIEKENPEITRFREKK